jgi:hypothetical protein
MTNRETEFTMRANISWSARHIAVSVVWCASLTPGCRKAESHESPVAAISAQQAADMLHAVMQADRAVYTTHVVNRLVNDQHVHLAAADGGAPEALRPSERWKSERGTLPLPAQMFRMGAERVAEENIGFQYALVSEWPINKQNKAKTDSEKAGLAAVIENRGEKPYYGSETLGEQKYFTAVYADAAVVPACVECHNGHKDSARHDFKLGDVMGGIVIRIPI